MTHFQSVEVINFGHNNIKEDAKDCLIKSVLRNSSIINIVLEENPIYKKGSRIDTLFKTLEEVRKCGDRYDFKGHLDMLQAFVELLTYVNDFEDKSCDIIDNIEYLYVKDCYQAKRHKQYTTETARIIVIRFIRHLSLFKKLRIIDLSNTYLTAEAIQELPDFLRSTNTLERLDLSENTIKAEGAVCIFKQLQDVDHTVDCYL